MTDGTSRGELTPEEIRQTLLRHSQRRFRRDLIANYRTYLAPTVKRASPLLLDVCSAWGVDLDTMLARLRPPGGWPYMLRRRKGGARLASVIGKGLIGPRVHAVVGEDGLDVRTWLGDAFACTDRGQLQLWLTQRLPDTLLDSFPGRNLATVIDHPILRMQPYLVTQSYYIGHLSVIEAEAPPVPFQLAWA